MPVRCPRWRCGRLCAAAWRDRAPWADCGPRSERVSSAPGSAACPVPSRPTAHPYAVVRRTRRRGGAGRGAGRVRAPAGRRLCVLRQTGDQRIAGIEQFLFVDDVVAVEDGAARVAGQAHGDPLGDIRADQGAGGGAATIVEEAGRHPGDLTGRALRGAPAADRNAVSATPCRRCRTMPRAVGGRGWSFRMTSHFAHGASSCSAMGVGRGCARKLPVRLEFVVRPPLGAEPSPGSGRPNGPCSVRHGPPCPHATRRGA